MSIEDSGKLCLGLHVQNQSINERKENIVTLVNKNKNKNKSWIIDFSSNRNLCNDNKLFCELNIQRGNSVATAKLIVRGKFHCTLRFLIKKTNIALRDVLLVPVTKTTFCACKETN